MELMLTYQQKYDKINIVKKYLRICLLMSRNLKVKIITFVFTMVAVAGLIWFMISGDNSIIVRKLFGDDDLTSEQLIELIRSFGIRGSITLSILSMMQVIIPFMPEEPVQVLTGMGYGVWHGALICLAGIVLGNTIIYFIYKVFGSKSVSSMHKSVDLDFEKIRSSKRIAMLILLLYILPAVPLGAICLFACSLDLRYPRFLFLTTIGAIPSVLVGVSLGHMTMATSWVFSVVVFGIILILVIIFMCNKKKIYNRFNEYIRKHQFSYNSEIVAKKPNAILYFIFKLGGKIFIRHKFNIKKTINAKVKGPAIVLCNHGSFVDFLYAYSILMDKKPSTVTARLYFYNKKLTSLLKRMGAFPKSMFSADVENVKNCIRVLSQDRILIMMPEARLSTVGRYEGIQETTFKFLKKMNVPIYSLKINGGYLSMPKWSEGKWIKKPYVETQLDCLIDAEQIKTIDEQVLKEKVENALVYDEFKWLDAHKEIHYKSSTLAEGLENILYICPKCGKVATFVSHKMDIFCFECGLRATLNDRYAFVDNTPFNNFAEWYDYQKQILKEQIESNEDYKLEGKVQLNLPSKDGKAFVRKAGNGICTLDRAGLLYKGTCDGEQIEKFFPMSSIYRLLFGAGEDFEIYDNKTLWYFVPENKRTCVIWYNASEILKNLSAD